ncbi:MAG: GNAT family N-acetyltransferase [Bacteroidales bacterium]|nr:GNAT family N-acetyltransferase [Bacteroidales bacterium]
MAQDELIYNPMLRCDIEECAQLAAQSFMDYAYFTTYFPDPAQREEFLRRAILSEYRTTFGRAQFLVACQEGIIVAVAQVFPPDYRKPSTLRYLTHGWWRVLALPCQHMVSAWSKMDAEAAAYCHAMMGGSTWYLSSLTVADSQKGKGFGSSMMRECIVPHVRHEGGSRLCLFTNSENNLHFYQRQGFRLVNEQHFSHDGHSLPSWSLVKKM